MKQLNSGSSRSNVDYTHLGDGSSFSDLGNANRIWGQAFLVREAYANGDLGSLWAKLYRNSLDKPTESGALLDMSTILLVSGQRELGLLAQRNALTVCRDYLNVFGQGDGLKVLAIMAPGDFMANTPIDFLLQGSNFKLIQRYVDENTTDLVDQPEHDIVFVAIAESIENSAILKRLEGLLRNLRAPIVNNAPKTIENLTRDGVASMFNNSEKVFVPNTSIVGRSDLVDTASGQPNLNVDSSSVSYPFIVRPVGTHAGFGMKKINMVNELAVYLESFAGEQFYICPYIDYRNADGLFRKYRIAFIDRKPFPCHLAISENWMIHYLNAEMEIHFERRAEEADWFSNFESFARLHEDKFTELSHTVNLDYFVVDCGFMNDGRLLLFEADVGMIVHDMDPIELFPYKRPAMAALFSAFQTMLLEKSRERFVGDPTFLKSSPFDSLRTKLVLVHE